MGQWSVGWLATRKTWTPWKVVDQVHIFLEKLWTGSTIIPPIFVNTFLTTLNVTYFFTIIFLKKYVSIRSYCCQFFLKKIWFLKHKSITNFVFFFLKFIFFLCRLCNLWVQNNRNSNFINDSQILFSTNIKRNNNFISTRYKFPKSINNLGLHIINSKNKEYKTLPNGLVFHNQQEKQEIEKG